MPQHSGAKKAQKNSIFIRSCKLLKIRCRFSQKIQGTYFKISALYFKIYALCFLQQAMCLFPCRNMHVFCRIRVGEDSCEMQTTGGCLSQERLIFELESFRTSYLMFRKNHRTM